MWCSKCHAGNYNITWKLNERGDMRCGQCGHIAPPLFKSPFIPKNKQTQQRVKKEENQPKKEQKEDIEEAMKIKISY